jgi:hypothetical protein
MQLLEKRAFDAETTKNLWGGSIAAGAGVGLLGVLYDAVRSQRRRAAAESGKEDALYVDLPTTKQAYLWEPLAGAGMAAATAYGIREFYNNWKKDQLKKEVDEASGDYIQSLYSDVGVSKKAGALWAAAKDLAPDTAILAALASGIGTYGLLQHTFPQVKEKPAPGTPKKIIVRGYGGVKVDGPGNGPLAEKDQKKLKQEEPKANPEQVPEEQYRKVASFDFSKEDNLQSAELLCLSLTNHPTLKQASSPLLELLGAHARDAEGLGQTIKTAGTLGAVSSSKGESGYFLALPELEKRAAVYNALRDPVLSPSIVPLILAEYNEVSPAHAKVAHAVSQDPDLSAIVTKFASVFHTLETGTWLMDHPQEKTAAANKFMDASSENLGTLDLSSFQDSDGDDQRTSPDEVYRGKQDPIDKLLSPP